MSPQQEIVQAANLLASARHAVVFTGAGISTPSGIPDYRSKDTGLWEHDDPMEVSSLRVFEDHPERFYQWLRPLLRSILKAKPNPAHRALGELESVGILQAVVTQNIDNLHQRGGSQKVYEVHGSLRTMTCSRCQQVYPSDQFLQVIEQPDGIVHCPRCQCILKPDITLFGEMLPAETWQQAEMHCQNADVMVVVGSSLVVWPAAALPEISVRKGAKLIIINQSETHLDAAADVRIPYDAADILPQIAAMILRPV